MMNQAPKATECIVGIRNQLLYQNQLMYINMALEYGGRLGIKLEEIEAIQKIYRWVGKRIGLESDDEQAE